MYYSASRAAGPLADWVLATLDYSEILVTIEPLESKQRVILSSLDSQMKKVQACEKQIAELDAQVVKFQKEFGKKTQEAEVLKQDL